MDSTSYLNGIYKFKDFYQHIPNEKYFYTILTKVHKVRFRFIISVFGIYIWMGLCLDLDHGANVVKKLDDIQLTFY